MRLTMYNGIAHICTEYHRQPCNAKAEIRRMKTYDKKHDMKS